MQKIYNNIGDDLSKYILYIGTQDDFGNVRFPSGGLNPVVCGTTTGYNIVTDAYTRRIHYLYTYTCISVQHYYIICMYIFGNNHQLAQCIYIIL